MILASSCKYLLVTHTSGPLYQEVDVAKYLHWLLVLFHYHVRHRGLALHSNGTDVLLGFRTNIHNDTLRQNNTCAGDVREQPSVKCEDNVSLYCDYD